MRHKNKEHAWDVLKKNDGIHLARQCDPSFAYPMKTKKTVRKNSKTRWDPSGIQRDPRATNAEHVAIYILFGRVRLPRQWDPASYDADPASQHADPASYDADPAP